MHYVEDLNRIPECPPPKAITAFRHVIPDPWYTGTLVSVNVQSLPQMSSGNTLVTIPAEGAIRLTGQNVAAQSAFLLLDHRLSPKFVCLLT